MSLQSHVRRIAQRHLIGHRNIAFQLQSRCLSIPSTPSEEPKGPTEPYHYEKPQVQPAWLSKKILENPTSRSLFLKFMTLFGYGSKKQIAGRRAMYLYESLCAVKAEEDRDFWRNGAFFKYLLHFSFVSRRSIKMVLSFLSRQH